MDEKNLRDQFAVAVVQSIVRNIGEAGNLGFHTSEDIDTIAETAYRVADAMIRYRKEHP